ncbi:LCP family protein required for cell wall assembly [Catenuloplanes nepalensis]|uniref:LCP family protein required for cell wall assembly n=1 Tax=Catenuloplanes nepalensis TaxID=587533 RepID=A0ABT9N4Y5_9ACTN|nr:LCP family protein [Catenuloplanes nepalensis]MDP9798588.1 LCP family protein required for cell wall assembly [Catenuloplanes nepalensis]
MSPTAQSGSFGGEFRRDAAGPRARASAPGGGPVRGGSVRPGRDTGQSGEYGGPRTQRGNSTRSGGGGGGEPPRGGGRGVYSGGKRPLRPNWKRIALIGGIALLIFLIAAAGGLWAYASNLDGDLKRTDAFSELRDGRPEKPVDGTMNILLVGSDSRDPDAQSGEASEWRSDTIILMHVPADHSKAYLVSIPRDLYVSIPSSAGADCADGAPDKINAAFAFGGLPLAVKTVECFSDVRIDHVAAIDFAGFVEVTDALGGVDLTVEQDTKSIHKPFRVFEKGVNHMNGEEALDWIRQRYQFPDGDFARMRHQQEFLKALMDKAASSGTLTNAGKLDAFLKATTNAMTVDENFSLVDMALEFRSLRSDDLTFITSPNQGSAERDGQSVVVSDREPALALYEAIANDTMVDWIKTNAEPPAKTNP